jgi:hypothetical protein
MYQPKLARFVSRDPSPEDGVAVLWPIPDMRPRGYRFVAGRPTALTDPSGLQEEPDGGEPVPPRWIELTGLGIKVNLDPGGRPNTYGVARKDVTCQCCASNEKGVGLLREALKKYLALYGWRSCLARGGRDCGGELHSRKWPALPTGPHTTLAPVDRGKEQYKLAITMEGVSRDLNPCFYDCAFRHEYIHYGDSLYMLLFFSLHASRQKWRTNRARKALNKAFETTRHLREARALAESVRCVAAYLSICIGDAGDAADRRLIEQAREVTPPRLPYGPRAKAGGQVK